MFSHTAVDLWLSPSVVWTHAVASCCLLILQGDASIQPFCYKKLPSFSLHLHMNTKNSFKFFLHECSFTPEGGGPCVGAAWNPVFRPQQHPGEQHLSLWGVWVCNMEPTYMCTHVCACHSWHSTPARSVILCSLCWIWLFNYSQGCRNALINTVVLQRHIYCLCGKLNPLLLSWWQIWRHGVDEEGGFVIAL